MKPQGELTPGERAAHAAMRRASTAAPFKTADDMRELASAIWDLAHADGLAERQMVDGLAILSGMAVYALFECASQMEKHNG